MVEIRQLCAGYHDRRVLHGMDLTIPGGKLTVILGPNGCGKSTLLKVLCGILPLESGEVLLDGENVKTFSQRTMAQKVAYLAQSRHVPDITVLRLVLHGRFPYLGYPRRYRKEDYAHADRAMEAMGISDLADTPLQNLSGGQRQKVYIAMALAQDTPLILLDEPTTYLDISHQLQMMDHARHLTKQGKTVVMILHDLPHAFRTADHMILMENGRVSAEGAPEELYASGAVDRIFGIKLGRAHTEDGWRYFCERGI